jgi:predicted dehydrogenase
MEYPHWKYGLVEKPSISNAMKCQAFFDFHASIPEATRLVRLEAFHTRFHPAWYAFLSSIDSAAVQNVQSSFSMYWGFFPLKNQIRYDYDLAGGSLLDIGTYGVTAIREAFGTEPIECLDANARMHFDSETVDEGLKATFRFPNGGIGSIDGDLARQGWMGLP